VIEKGQRMTVRVKFIGSFHSLSGKDTLELRLERPCRIRDVIKMITEELPKLELALIDPGSENPKTNLLIIVNGQEMSVLDHFETAIKDGDEMVLVPIVHGG
jgi:MoaD family protein